MMCESSCLRWNLRNPLRAALSATATMLGGLLPHHLLYQPEQQRALQNWLWSVGDSPLSHTGTGSSFSTAQAELLHRHYVVAGLNASLFAQHDVYAALRALNTSRTNLALLRGEGGTLEGGKSEGGKLEGGSLFLQIKGAQLKLAELQRRVLQLASHHDLEGASLRLHSLQQDSMALLHMAEQVVAAFAPHHCGRGSSGVSASASGSLRLVAALLGLGIVTIATLRCTQQRQLKTLINKVD